VNAVGTLKTSQNVLAPPLPVTRDITRSQTSRSLPSVLILEGSTYYAERLKNAVLNAGAGTVTIVTRGRSGLEAALYGEFDLIVVDSCLPQVDGIEICSRVRIERDPPPPVIMTTALSSEQHRSLVYKAGAVDILQKPFYAQDAIARLRLQINSLRLQARQLALNAKVLETSRRIEADLEIARSMQDQLRPHGDELARIAARYRVGLAAHYQNLEEVGGDHVQCLEATQSHHGSSAQTTERERFGLLILDFTGHGLRAALNVFQSHSLVASAKLPDRPDELIAHLHKRLHALLPSNDYATAFFVIIEPRADGRRTRLHYAAAASPEPIIARLGPDGTYDHTELLDPTGPPLGFFEGSEHEYRAREAWLEPGDLLLLYSDAFFETKMRPGALPLSRGQDDHLGVDAIEMLFLSAARAMGRPFPTFGEDVPQRRAYTTLEAFLEMWTMAAQKPDDDETAIVLAV
jgi:sigma-B regulation protein RsbU (phosphoserine phosphatase)